MAAKAQKSFPTRVYILIAGFLVWSFILALRLVNLQLFQYIDLSKRAKRQQNRVFEISPKRGTIYDRRNRELAVSINVESVFAVPTEISAKDQAASQLARALNLSRADVLRKLTSSHSFAWLKRKA